MFRLGVFPKAQKTMPQTLMLREGDMQLFLCVLVGRKPKHVRENLYKEHVKDKMTVNEIGGDRS